MDEEQVSQACETIQSALAAYAADAQQVVSLAEAVAALHWLRGQYRENREAFEPHLPRLKACSAQLTDALKAAREQLIRDYLDAVRTISRAGRTRDACRDVLVELAGAEGVDQFDGPAGRIEVRRVEVLSLPEKDSPRRSRLARLLSESGRWEEVAHPNPTRLLRALEAGRFSAAQADEIRKLCAIERTARLTGHPK